MINVIAGKGLFLIIYGKMRGTDVIIETLRLRKNVTVQYLHSYESKSIENRLWRWDFDLYVSG